MYVLDVLLGGFSTVAILLFVSLVWYKGFFGLQVLCIFVLVYAHVYVQVCHIAHYLLHIAHCMAQCTAVSGLCICMHLGTGMVFFSGLQVLFALHWCTCMTSCWKLSLAAILFFAFWVYCEGFFGQVRMHVCVHLHTRACIRLHSSTGTGAGMYVHNVLLEVLNTAAILPFAF